MTTLYLIVRLLDEGGPELVGIFRSEAEASSAYVQRCVRSIDAEERRRRGVGWAPEWCLIETHGALDFLVETHSVLPKRILVDRHDSWLLLLEIEAAP